MARGSQFVVDLSVIETECENFKNCSGKYQNSTHSYFKNSYLTKCNDSQIRRAVSKISTYYENVKKDYDEIYKWWKSYIDNVNGLENYLSNQGLSTLSEQSLINYLKCSLEELESYNFDIEIAYGSFNKQAGSYNSGTDKIDKLNHNNASNYKNNLNGKFDTQSLNKNKNTTKQSSNFNNDNFAFDDIGTNYRNSDSSLNIGEVTFNDIFGSGKQNNSIKNGASGIDSFDVGSKIKSFFNSIEVLSDNTFNKGKKYSVQKSSIGFGATAAMFGLGSMGNRRSNKKNSSETSRYSQGNYKGSATDTNNSSNKSSFTNNNSFKNKDSYVNLMNTQNIEMGNNNFNLKNIVNISKKIIGLIKSIATNSIVICNTNGVGYQTTKADIKATGAKIGEANSINLINKTEYLKTNTARGYRAFGTGIFSQTKTIVKNDNIRYRQFAKENALSSDEIRTKLNEKMKDQDIPRTNPSVLKVGKTIKLGKDVATIKSEEIANSLWNNLNVLLSKFSNKDFLEKNKHLEASETFDWMEASSELNEMYKKDLDTYNIVIDNQYRLYENLTYLSETIAFKSIDNLTPQQKEELLKSINETVITFSISGNITDNEQALIINLSNLSTAINNNQFTEEYLDSAKTLLLSSLLEEKSMTSQIIYQYEIARDQLKYGYIEKMDDFDEVSNFSNLYDQCQFDKNGNVIKKATISYNSDTRTITINGVTYTDYIDYNDPNTIIDETGYVVKADHAYAMVDKLTLSYLISKGLLEFPEGENNILPPEYAARNVSFMTEDEVKKYHYLYEKYGEYRAEDYFRTLQDSLNQRKGFQDALEYFNSLEGKNYAEKLVSLHLTGIGDGMLSWAEGINDIIFADGILSSEQYKQMWLLQILNGNVDIESFSNTDKELVKHLTEQYESTGKSLGYSYQIGNTVGNMLPSLIMTATISPLFATETAVVGGIDTTTKVGKIISKVPQIVSSTSIGLSTYGNTKNQALHDGYTMKSANTQAFFSALAEGGLEYFLGNIPGISKESSNTILGFLREGGEECLQEFAGMCISMANGEYISFDQFTETEIQTFVMSVIVSAEMNGANATLSFAGNTIVLSADKINQICNEQGVAGVEAYIREKIVTSSATDLTDTNVTSTDAITTVSENINEIKSNIDELNSDNLSVIAVDNEGKILNQEVLNSKIDTYNEKIISNKKRLKYRLKEIMSTTLPILEIASFFLPINPVIQGVVVAHGAFKLYMNSVYEARSEHSLFSVVKGNHAIQMDNVENFGRKIKEMKDISNSYEKKSIGLSANLRIQLANLFFNLEATNKKGEKITYTAQTHDSVLKMLVELRDKGFIEGVNTKLIDPNLTKVEVDGKTYTINQKYQGLASLIQKGDSYKTTNLKVERVMLGGIKAIFDLFKNNTDNKKLDYEIKFQLTDKKFTEADALDLIKKFNKDGQIGILYDKDGSPYMGLKSIDKSNDIKVEKVNHNSNNINEQYTKNLNDYNRLNNLKEEIELKLSDKYVETKYNYKDLQIQLDNVNKELFNIVMKMRDNIFKNNFSIPYEYACSFLESDLAFIVDNKSELSEFFTNQELNYITQMYNLTYINPYNTSFGYQQNHSKVNFNDINEFYSVELKNQNSIDLNLFNNGNNLNREQIIDLIIKIRNSAVSLKTYQNEVNEYNMKQIKGEKGFYEAPNYNEYLNNQNKYKSLQQDIEYRKTIKDAIEKFETDDLSINSKLVNSDTNVGSSIEASVGNLNNEIDSKVDAVIGKIAYNNMTIEDINAKLKEINPQFEHNVDAKSFIDDLYLNLKSLSGDYGVNQSIVNWMFVKHSTDFKERLDILKDYVKAQLPNMNFEHFTQYISTLDSAQGGICSYAPQVNAIINFFWDKQTLFKEKFGLDLFYNRKGINGRNIDIDVAQDILLADFFTFINKYNYLNDNNTDFKVENNELVYEFNSGVYEEPVGIAQTLTQYSLLTKMGSSKYIIPIMDYFKGKGLDLSVKYNSLYNSNSLATDFVDLDLGKRTAYLLENIKKALNKNETIMIVVSKGKTDGLYIYNTPETLVSNNNVFAWTGKQEFNDNKLSKHAMTITGVTENGMLIVDTWGYRKYISLEEFIKNFDGHISSIDIEQKQLDTITQYYLDNKVNLKYITKVESLFANDAYNLSNISQYIDICKKVENHSTIDYIEEFYKTHNRILNENELKIVEFINSKNDYNFKSILKYFMEKGQFVEVEQYYSFYEKMGFSEQQDFLNFMLKDDKIFNSSKEIIDAVNHHFELKKYIAENLSSKFSNNISNKFKSLEFSSKVSNEQIENFCKAINLKNNENQLNEAFIDIILNSNSLSSDNIELITKYINDFTLPKFINNENISDFVEFVYEIPYNRRSYKNLDNIINFYDKLSEFNLEKDSYSKNFMEHYGMAKRINFDINTISIDKMKQLCNVLDSKVSENKFYPKLYEYIFNYALIDINNQNIDSVINTVSNELILPTNCDESMLTSIIHFINKIAENQNSYNIDNYKELIGKVEDFYNVDIGYGNGAKALVFEKFLESNPDNYNINSDLLLKWTKEIFDICTNKLGQYNINNSQENTLLSKYYKTQNYNSDMFDQWCKELGITKKAQEVKTSLNQDMDDDSAKIQQQKNRLKETNDSLKEVNLNKTWDMITISTLDSIINNPEIVDKFLNFNDNLDYFGTQFSQKKYFETFENFKNEIDKGNYKVSDDAYNNLTKLLEPNLKQQINNNKSNIDALNWPFKMLEDIVEIDEIRNKFLDYDNNIDYFGGISKQQYLEWFHAIELAIIVDDQLIVSNHFKKNLGIILSAELKSIHPSFNHTFYALSKLDDIFLNFFFNSSDYGPNQSIIQKMLKNPQNYKDRFSLIEDSIRKILPEISDKQIYKFLSALDASKENGGNGGICSYAATVGSILKHFVYNQSDFKKAFGADLINEVVDDNGNKHIEFSQDLIIAELYAYINKGNWESLNLSPDKKVEPDFKRKINGDWQYKYNSGIDNNELQGVNQTIVKFFRSIEMSKSLECIPITSYLKNKNLNLGLEMKSIYNSSRMSVEYQNMSNQEKLSYLENEIQKSLNNERYLTIAFYPKKNSSLDLYLDHYCYSRATQLDGGHIMTVTGITYSESDHSAIIKVSTWAGIKYFKLSDYVNNGAEGVITEFNIHNIENNGLVNFYVENEVKLDELMKIQSYLDNNSSASIDDVEKLLQNYRINNYPFRTLVKKIRLESILKNMILVKQKFKSTKETIIKNINLKKQQNRLKELEQIRNSTYNANEMPLSNKPDLREAQEKVIKGVELSFKDKLILGRDHPIKNIDGYELKPNCVYRAISEELYNEYLEKGYIFGYDINDEYQEYTENGQTYNNNKGVDWYLGGVDLKYGPVIIECPASKEYFIPAFDNGSGMALDPTVRHMKSSGFKKPVPMSMVRLIKHPNIKIDINQLNNSNIVKNLFEIDKEYYKLKNIVDIKTTDENVFLKNELARLLEQQQINPNDVKLNEKIQQLKEAIASIDDKKRQITYITWKNIHDLASEKVKEIDIPKELLKYSESHATEILESAKVIEKQITNDMQLLESDNSSLIGEEYKLKDVESLTRKIISDAINNTKKDITDLSFADIDKAAFEIGDGLRYTLLIEEDVYKETVKLSLDELTKKGYRVVNFKNSWTKPHYKGINVSIQSPTGFLLELQFHTPYSFKTKETLTHEFYQIKRNTSLSKDVQENADQIQIAYQSLVDIPKDIVGYNWLTEYNEKVGKIEILDEID